MKIRHAIATAIAAGMLSTAALAAPADEQFATLEGISAQPMTAQEMEAIEGQIDLAGFKQLLRDKITNQRLEDALIATIDRLNARFPRLVNSFLNYLTVKYGL